jgi:uncharacterized protein (DUF58 family)
MAGEGVMSAPRPTAFIDPAALMRIRNLELRAKTVVEGFMSGMHRSPYHGFSVEFTEYRQYVPGDDLRYLDWRRLARSDREYIKRFEDETNLRAWLLLDLSQSMGYGSLAYNKAEYAKTVAATLAYFLSLQRDATGLITFDQTLQEYLPARFRPGHLHRLMMCLERSTAGKGTDLIAPLDQVAQMATKRGMVVLLSDMLAPIADLEKNLGYVRSRGHEVVLLRVLDPTELDFPFQDPAMFHDLESGRELYVDPASAKSVYQAKFRAHQAELKQVCDRVGIVQYELRTDEPVERSLFDLLSARMKSRRTTRRASSTGARGGR